MRSLYFDMTSGISGDIALSSLLSLGVDCNELSEILSNMLSKKINLSLEKVYRNSVLCNRLIIDTDIKGEPYRYLNNIIEIINKADCENKVKEKAIKSFQIIAEAESIVHGISIDEVHFHEIGAVDTIIDLFGISYCLNKLEIEKVTSNIVTSGSGYINTAHGVMPLPAPAVIKILENIPIKRVDVEGEMVTPTGAAVLKTYVSEFTNSFQGIVVKDSFSTGSKEFKGMANFMRAIIFENDYNNEVVNITTNIDNMTGEQLGYLYEKLMDYKALDVVFIPAFSKKNRPMYILNVICDKANKENIIYNIFKYSSTIGMRVENVNRVIAERKFIEKEIMGEKVKVKQIMYKDIFKEYIEYEDAKNLADKLNLPIETIMYEVHK